MTQTQRDLWKELCSYENIELAFKKARKHKTQKPYVIEFEKSLRDNLLELRSELLLHSYKPQPLKTFILRDPKTRKISKSEFKDRVAHHALCNILEPIFEKSFIYDSYANRKGKGAHKALQRFDYFKRKVSSNGKKKANYFDNNDVIGYALKADIKHYFEEVDHKILLGIIRKKIKDARVLWLIKKILSNYESNSNAKGMPLGNLTSQFFANVYLNEIDQFAKHKLKAKYYIRYVDDFVILHRNEQVLYEYKEQIGSYLKSIKLELHPDKSKILSLNRGVALLGYIIFYHYKLLRKSNLREFCRKLYEKISLAENKIISYDELLNSIHGWMGYSIWANTYNLRKNVVNQIDRRFCNNISEKDIGNWLKAPNIQ